MQTSRRTILKQMALSTLAMGSSMPLSAAEKKELLKNNIHHSVCHWSYNFLTLDELCEVVKKIGFNAIDLVGPAHWPILKKHGVFSSMCNGAEINLVDGWIDPAFHPTLIKNYAEHIDLTAKAGYKNLICFSGSRRGMDEETALKNMTEGIKKIIGQAEKKGIILHVEVLNSKIDHKDYMADNTAWAVELCKRIGSENFKILYDIYHMQVDEGDIIHTIRDNFQYFGHYHTAGVPGRHEIDESQELNYAAIMKAILATGYKGYVAQEFISSKNTRPEKIEALAQAVKICDV